jgi:CheY-like chemotaxis protein
MNTPSDPSRRSADAGEGAILVVEDDPDLLSATSTILSMSGFNVLEAKDGVEALSKYRAHQHRISLVLMDVEMPNLGGIEATQKIREIDPSAKVVLTSGYSEHPVNVAHPDAFLPKPYRFDTLCEVVHKVLNVGSIDSHEAEPLRQITRHSALQEIAISL